MKNEPRIAISGLKAAGVIALLASLLVLLPAASAESYALRAEVTIYTPTAIMGDDVEYYYTLTNTGDTTLYNVAIEGLGDEDPAVIAEMKPGQVVEVVGYYTIDETSPITVYGGRNFVINNAKATAKDINDRTVVTSGTVVAILIFS